MLFRWGQKSLQILIAAMGRFDHRHHKASFSSTHNPMNRHLVGMLARASPSCTRFGSRASNHVWPRTEGGKEEVSTTLVCHSKGTLRHPSCWLRWWCDPKEQHNTARHHQETATKTYDMSADEVGLGNLTIDVFLKMQNESYSLILYPIDYIVYWLRLWYI